MDTAERIVEAYVRYLRKWATIPNIRCPGQGEIDLLAIDPKCLERYHIEVGISVAQGFSKLTAKPFSAADLKDRVKQPQQRRTLGFFLERKFRDPGVLQTLAEHGLADGSYTKVIVSWGWEPGVAGEAKEAGVELWDFRNVIQEIAAHFSAQRLHLPDDTLRTLHLYALAAKQEGQGFTGAPWEAGKVRGAAKAFDCVEMQHRGGARVYAVTKDMTIEEEVAYWERRTEELRQRLAALHAEDARAKT